jgi:acyl-CoA thioesterase-1
MDRDFIRRNFFLCVLIIFCGFTAGCDQSYQTPQSTPTASTSTANTPNSTQDERIILAFGDSLTAGLGVSTRESYPSQLEARLHAMGYSYRVINAGISGDTTAGGVRRLDWAIKTKPDVVILALGANDGLRGIPLNEVRTNLGQMIKRLKTESIPVVLAGMKLPPNYGPMYTVGFSNLYAQLARENDIPLIPFLLEGVAAHPELNQEDGIHPTAEGYRRVVDNILPVLLPLLTNQSHSKP